MKTILAIFLVVLLLLPVSAFGEIQTITHTVKQPFGGSQSPDDARISAVAKAKREALEIAGTYIESLTVVKNSHVDKDEILALAAGVLKAEVVSQKNYASEDAFSIDVVVKVVVDTSVLEDRVKKLLQDRTHLEQLNQARKKEKELLNEVVRLVEENRRLMGKKQSSGKLKKQFEEVSQELTAVDWYDKALTLWDITLSGANISSFLPDIIADGGKSAVEYLSTAITLTPNYSAAYLTRGNIFSVMGQKSLAMKDYKKVVQLEKPKDSFGYARRGSAYKGLKDYQSALQDYDHAIQLQPDNPLYYSSRGFIYFGLKQYQRAIKDFDEVIRLTPDDGDAYSNRGLVYQKLGQHQQAIQDFSEAIRLKPEWGDVYASRGDVYGEMRIWEHAIEDYSRAILLRPGCLDYVSRGYAYGIIGQHKQAIRDFDQAILLKPDYAESYFARGLEYVGQDQHYLAIKDFDQAILLKPDYAKAYDLRGKTYILSGNSREGCPSLIRACELGKCDGYNWAKGKGHCY